MSLLASGHPIFVAQHATGTCRRSCLQKWLKIPAGRELSPAEVSRVVDVILRWIGDAVAAQPPAARPASAQLTLPFTEA